MAKKPLFSSQFRTKFSEKMMDLGNFIAIALIISQFATNKEFSTDLFLVGFLLTVIFYIISYIVSR